MRKITESLSDTDCLSLIILINESDCTPLRHFPMFSDAIGALLVRRIITLQSLHPTGIPPTSYYLDLHNMYMYVHTFSSHAVNLLAYHGLFSV